MTKQTIYRVLAFFIVDVSSDVWRQSRDGFAPGRMLVSCLLYGLAWYLCDKSFSPQRKRQGVAA